MKNLINILLLVLLLFFTFCDKNDNDKNDIPNNKRHEWGHFPDTVVNFGDVNSVYDDYNSTSPVIMNRYLLRFSSNRSSSGDNFDIAGNNMYIAWEKDEGKLDVKFDLYNYPEFNYLKPMFDSVNTKYNELGPYALTFRKDINNEGTLWTDLIMFANDSGGDYDIKFTYIERHINNKTKTISKVKPIQTINFCNSNANDLYPTFCGTTLYTHYNFYGNSVPVNIDQIEKMLFCSDREGKFNLYSVDLQKNTHLIDVLKSDAKLEVSKININSEQDDKCPFVNGKLLVFASNRAGGYGGFDLYYSEFKNGNWTEPKNFGDKINTKYDEYRPIVMNFEGFDNNLMIFSSNRPGGKGGFDLHYVGITQTVKDK